MKKRAARKSVLLSLFLFLTCCTIHGWHFSLNDIVLPYLPQNAYLPVGILTGLMVVLAFLDTFLLLKECQSKHPFLLSLVSAIAMLLAIIVTALFLLSYVARRYAGYLPVPILPDIPLANELVCLACLCLLHPTALLICRLIKQKPGALRVFLSVGAWLLLNGLLFLMTV